MKAGGDIPSIVKAFVRTFFARLAQALAPKYYAILWIAALYLALAVIGTYGDALFAGDNAGHIAQIDDLFETGMFRWYDASHLGFPLFFFHQPIPHLVSSLFFTNLGPIAAYRTLVIMLFAAVPFSLFFSLRWMGFSENFSLSAALAPLLISSFTGFGIEPAGVFGWGLYTQLWAIAVFPISLALLWHAVDGRIAMWMAGLGLALLFLVHAMVGVMAVLTLAAIVLSRGLTKKRLIRSGGIVFLTLILLSFWLVPIIEHRDSYLGMTKSDEELYSYGFPKVTWSLIKGDILDYGRLFPALTIISAAGVILAWRGSKQKPLQRFILLGLALGFVLFCGGKYLVSIPGFSFFELHRFLFLFHFFLLLAFADAAAWMSKNKILIILLFALLTSLFAQAVMETKIRQETINVLSPSPVTTMKEIGAILAPLPEGRVHLIDAPFEPSQALLHLYSGQPLLYGGLGSQDSLTTSSIKGKELDELDLSALGVSYVVSEKRISGMEEIAYVPPWYVQKTGESGYFRVDPGCGDITREWREKEGYHAMIIAEHECTAHFSMTYWPLWEGYIDDARVAVQREKGTLMGVAVGPGEHIISFRYQDVNYRLALVIVSLLILFVFYKAEEHPQQGPPLSKVS